MRKSNLAQDLDQHIRRQEHGAKSLCPRQALETKDLDSLRQSQKPDDPQNEYGRRLGRVRVLGASILTSGYCNKAQSIER